LSLSHYQPNSVYCVSIATWLFSMKAACSHVSFQVYAYNESFIRGTEHQATCLS